MATEFSLRPLDTSYDHGIDWCEPNFRFSTYIAEFWNFVTVTPLTICFLLLLSNFLYLKYHLNVPVEPRFLVAISMYTISTLTGLFTHATLWGISGMLDEFSAYISNVCHCYMIFFALRAEPVPRRVHIALLSSILIYGIILAVWPFAGGLLSVATQAANIAVGFLFLFFKKWNGGLFDTLNLFRALCVAVLSISIGGTCAFVDYVLCDMIEYSVLHSVFHIGSGIAVQLFVVVLFQIRVHVLDKKMKFVSAFGCKDFPLLIKLKTDEQPTDEAIATEVVDMPRQKDKGGLSRSGDETVDTTMTPTAEPTQTQTSEPTSEVIYDHSGPRTP